MKNTIKLLGIFTLVTVIGFSMVACGDSGSGDSSSPGGDGPGGQTGGGTAGTLVITGLPAKYEGKYGWFVAQEGDRLVMGVSSLSSTGTVTFARIQGGQVTMKTYNEYNAPYNGNHSFNPGGDNPALIWIQITDVETTNFGNSGKIFYAAAHVLDKVTFSNGGANLSATNWSFFEQ